MYITIVFYVVACIHTYVRTYVGICMSKKLKQEIAKLHTTFAHYFRGVISESHLQNKWMDANRYAQVEEEASAINSRDKESG